MLLTRTTRPLRRLSLLHRLLRLTQAPSLRRCLRPRPTPLLPIHPTPLILTHILVPSLARNACSCGAPHARFAEENYFFVGGGLGEVEAVFEFFGGEEECVWVACDGEVDGGGD